MIPPGKRLVRKMNAEENHGMLGAAQPQPNEKFDREKQKTELTTEYTEHLEQRSRNRTRLQPRIDTDAHGFGGEERQIGCGEPRHWRALVRPEHIRVNPCVSVVE